MVIAYQTFGDMLRFNPHFHAIVLEGGFDEEGNFVFIPFSGLEKMTEYFRRKVINLFLEKNLITKSFSRNLLGWKHSGFSIDNSVRILTDKARTSLAEYITRAPVSLKKLHYEPFKGRVLFHTRYNQYFGENVHMFDSLDFLAELTGTPARAGTERSDQGQHIPLKGVQYIRRYGLYASRTRGKWTEHPEIIKHAPSGWKAEQQESSGNEKTIDVEESEVSDRTSRKAWARLLTKVYEIDPMVCPK